MCNHTYLLTIKQDQFVGEVLPNNEINEYVGQISEILRPSKTSSSQVLDDMGLQTQKLVCSVCDNVVLQHKISKLEIDLQASQQREHILKAENEKLLQEIFTLKVKCGQANEGDIVLKSAKPMSTMLDKIGAQEDVAARKQKKEKAMNEVTSSDPNSMVRNIKTRRRLTRKYEQYTEVGLKKRKGTERFLVDESNPIVMCMSDEFRKKFDRLAKATCIRYVNIYIINLYIILKVYCVYHLRLISCFELSLFTACFNLRI